MIIKYFLSVTAEVKAHPDWSDLLGPALTALPVQEYYCWNI